MNHEAVSRYLFDFNEDEVVMLDARDLYLYLEEDRGFDWWIQSRISEYDFTEGKDYAVEQDDSSTRYLLCHEMALELAIVQDNAIGRNVRLYLIEREEEFTELYPHLRSVGIPIEFGHPFRLNSATDSD